MNLTQLEAQNTSIAYDAFWQQASAYYGEKRRDLYAEIIHYLNVLYPAPCRLSIADIGCGPGWFLNELKWSQSGYDLALFGVDWSKVAVEQARQHVPDGHFITADLSQGSPVEAAFDVVFCVQTLEHVTDPARFIEHTLSMVGQHLIITVPDGPKDTYAAHVNFWSKDEFRAFCEPFGRVVMCKHIRGGSNILAHIEKDS